MSYLAFELDALNACTPAGAACGLSAAQFSHGLLQLWAWCFRTEGDVVKPLHIKGFFSGVDCSDTLIAFGFLAEVETGLRVKGAERYLRLKEARRKGGLASKGNLRRGGTQPGPVPGTSRASAGDQPELTPGSLPALSPSTEHRAPFKDTAPEKPGAVEEAPKKLKPAPSGEHQQLIAKLCEAFESIKGCGYLFSGAKDGPAVAALLKTAPADEILGRWRLGLGADPEAWESIATIAQLRGKWNDLAPKKPKYIPLEDRPFRKI